MLTTAAVLVLGGAPVMAAGHSYNVTDIGPTATGTSVYVNYPSHVAGTAPSRHGVWFYDGTLHQIHGPAAASEVVAAGLSNYDDILARATFNHGRIYRLFVVMHPASNPVWLKLPLPTGYVSSQPGGIGAWGNVVAGSIRHKGSILQKPALWFFNGKTFGLPLLLRLPAGTNQGTAASVDKGRGGIYVADMAASGDGARFRAAVWIHRGGKTWTSLLQASSGSTSLATSIADGEGATRYVAGILNRGGGPVPTAVVWTLHCWGRCVKMIHPRTLAPLGGAEWVNREGSVVGSGHFATPMIWNADHTSWKLPLIPTSINDKGNIAGVVVSSSYPEHAGLAMPAPRESV